MVKLLNNQTCIPYVHTDTVPFFNLVYVLRTKYSKSFRFEVVSLKRFDFFSLVFSFEVYQPAELHNLGLSVSTLLTKIGNTIYYEQF